MQIAKEIWHQMRHLDANLIMCMGVNKVQALKDGLRFKVQGAVFTGSVEIKLNASDLYDISLIKSKRHYYVNELDGPKRYINKDETVKEIKGVYFDELMPTLNEHIERI